VPRARRSLGKRPGRDGIADGRQRGRYFDALGIAPTRNVAREDSFETAGAKSTFCDHGISMGSS
jgi:hypothetical protein